jgi:hypothetical protein
MKDLISKKQIKKQWKKYIKKEEFVDFLSFYKSIKCTAQSMMLEMIDFLFLESIYNAFIELLELNNNIDIMLSTHSYETIMLCKERVDYLLRERAENWYL